MNTDISSSSMETSTIGSIAVTKIRHICELNNLKKNKTILIAGFPGPGLVGSISTSYIIEKLNMHQVAFVESPYITPGVMFIDGKLRHPFRLYANKEGDVCILVCEAPIMIGGIHFVLEAVMDWAIKNSIEEVMVLDGIPVNGLPDSNRKAVILASEIRDGYTHHSNDLDDSTNMDKNNENENEKDIKDKENYPVSDERSHLESNFNRDAIEDATKKYTTYIGGIAGGLLSACLSYQIPCAAILIPSSSGIPDPEGASLLIESYNNFIKDGKLKIDTKQLRDQGQKLKKQLEQIIKAEQEQRSGVEPGSFGGNRVMYG